MKNRSTTNQAECRRDYICQMTSQQPLVDLAGIAANNKHGNTCRHECRWNYIFCKDEAAGANPASSTFVSESLRDSRRSRSDRPTNCVLAARTWGCSSAVERGNVSSLLSCRQMSPCENGSRPLGLPQWSDHWPATLNPFELSGDHRPCAGGAITAQLGSHSVIAPRGQAPWSRRVFGKRRQVAGPVIAPPAQGRWSREV